MRTLFLTHRLPYAPNRGDRIRAFHVLRALATFSQVDLVSLVHDQDEAAQAHSLADLARVTVVPVSRLRNLLRAGPRLLGRMPLTHALLDGPSLRPALEAAYARQPDLVLAFCSGMARYALLPPLGGLPFVLDMVDVDSCKWDALADASRGPMRAIYRREAWTLRRFEAEATRRARAPLVVNDRERDALIRLAPGAAIPVVPNGIDLASFRLPRQQAPVRDPDTVVFCGVMNYAPNEAGVLWFAEKVWPLVLRERPGARFLVVGSHPTQAVQAMAASQPSIRVTGTVAEVQPYLWRAALSVAPLQVARGLQNKVLEAVAAGLPVVATPAVLDGIPREALPACAAAADPGGFAQAVLRLLALSGPEREALVAHADLTTLTWERRLAPLRKILARAAGRVSTPPAPSLCGVR
ncbi:MAG TPA: TIGR03087 family PEP-CTERM/XrtA system glycosyltransferase [Candidatus Acidoferrum sp.]|nr:TIGR03087 family PEP-CTERM/XrtA system glycosyltransferase [Candidatus Acidoferrum sp.]